MRSHRFRGLAGNAGGIPTDGLVAHYTMDNISGSTLVDEAGNYDGAITGATQTPGVIGQALSFGGSAYVAASFGLQSSAVTWSVWFKTTQTTSGILVAQESTAGSGEQRAIFVTPGGICFFSRDAADGYQQTPVLAGYQDGAWHLAIAEQNGAALSLLIDDVDVTTLGMPSVLATSSWKIETDLGRRRTAAALYYTGELDQFRQYDRVLTAAEKTALYNEGA